MPKKNAKNEKEVLKELTAEEVLDQYEKDELSEADLEFVSGGVNNNTTPYCPDDDKNRGK